MIRRDYIIRMIEECIQALARIMSLVKAKEYAPAATALDEQFQKLVSTDADAVARLSESELLARVMVGEPTTAVRTKCLLLTALLKQAAEIHAAQGRDRESQACLVKALNLLLDVLCRDEGLELPDFVPKVEELWLALKECSLPVATNLALMQHFERIGEFAKAEDRLFAMIENDPENLNLRHWGIAFYERLAGKSDPVLAAGNLPRPEVEAGLAELREFLRGRSSAAGQES